MATPPAGAAWAPHVARAAVLLAGLAVVLTSVTVVGALLETSLLPGR